MATVRLLYSAERLLLVDTPQTHRAEEVGVRNMSGGGEVGGGGSGGNKNRKLKSYPSSAPVIMCSSFIS